MIGNASGNYSSNISRTSGGAVSHSRARILLHTAAALSLAGPRRAASGGRSRRRAVARTEIWGPSFTPAQRLRPEESRRSAVRVRESAGAPQPVKDDSQTVTDQGAGRVSHNKGRPARAFGKRRHRGPAGGRTGSTPSAARVRQERSAAALDDAAGVRHRERRNHESGPAPCAANSTEVLGQHNFSRIHDDLDGCYRLATNITLQGEAAAQLPVGNSSHPFTGSLDGDGYSLSVHLTRSQGDALLFGAIDRSRIHLDLVDSHLQTHNGSRAALVGEMRVKNELVINRLQDSLFNATGEGTVEAGLVASTTGAGNALRLHNARGNQVVARALPRPVADSASCTQMAAVSLGLGTLWHDVRPSSHSYVGESVRQHELRDNRLHAFAGNLAGGCGANSRALASAGLLGILDEQTDLWPRALWSRQEGVYDNSIEAEAGGQTDMAASCSHASLGYGSNGCEPDQPTTGSRQDWLAAWQIGCSNNTQRARSLLPAGMDPVQNAASVAVARVNLVATTPLYSLRLQQSDVQPGPLLADSGDGADNRTLAADRALLPRIQDGRLYLFSGGATDLPLFTANDSDMSGFSFWRIWRYLQPPFGCIDRAGYDHAPLTASQQAIDARIRHLTVSSLFPAGWRSAHQNFGASLPWFGPLESRCRHDDSRLHYPHEALQSLSQTSDTGFLVTRQHYPGRPAHDLQGLLRVTPYLVDGKSPWPRPQAGTRKGGIRLYRPQDGDGVLQRATAVGSLVQGEKLYQLYQPQGAGMALVSLPLDSNDGHYHLTQHDDLAGVARLLSVEEGELHLWTQDGRDTLLAYNLGAEPVSNSSRPVMGFDLSDQPGGEALLARAGDWIYSLRQETGQAASLRRYQLATGQMDRHWQPAWPGNLTAGLRLVVAQDRLTAVPPGVLAAHGNPAEGFRARVPDGGGCLQWSRVALAYYPLPADSVATTGGTPDAEGTTAQPATAATAPAAGGEGDNAGLGQWTPLVVMVSTTVPLGTLCTLCTLGGLCLVMFSRGYGRRQQAALAQPARHDGEQAPAPAIACTLSEETAV